MADDLSLLFRLRADNAQAKAILADTRAAVAQLRQSFGPELTQTISVADKAFSSISDNLNLFVSQRVPLVGGAFIRITENLRGLTGESKATEKAIASVAKSIESIATQSGKTIPQITTFLTKFIQIEGQANRDKEAINFFGAALAQKLIPELETTGTALATVASEGAAVGSSMAAIAGPVGIAVVAVVALGLAAGVAAKQLFDLTKSAAEFQGKMFDLAQQTGLAVETLSALEVVAKTTGGELGSITQAIVLFQRKLDDAQDPLSKTAEQFRKLNVDTSDTETSLRSAFAALAAMPEGFAQTNAAAELFGARGGKQVLAILKETNGDLDGTIKRLREAGILISDDAARAADIFNDQLALLEFQIRALTAAAAEDLIPVMVEAIRAFGNLASAIRPIASILGSLTATGLRPVIKVLKDVSIAVQLLTGDYEGLARAIKEAQEAQNIAPIKIPEIRPVPLPGAPSAQQLASEAVNAADAVLAIIKRNAATTNQALDELFQRGRLDRQRQTESIIADNKKILEADKARIDALLAQKEQEIKVLDEAARNRGEIVNRETEQYRAINAAVAKLQQERLDKENEFDVTSRALRAKAAQERANAIRSQIQNEGDILVKEFDRTIQDIEAQIKRGVQAEEEGLRTIDLLEQGKLDAQLETVRKKKDVGFLTIQEQRDLDNELQKLQQQKDQLDDQQRARRLQREVEAAARNREILIANLETLLELEQIAGERRISTLKALADQRVITEEEAARQILKIRLDLIDDEITATETKLTAAKSITDKNERIRTQTELNNQIKILTEQRKTIQADGDRDIEAGRQKDLDNERRYAAELENIKRRIRDIERDSAEEVIRLMIIHFASRRDILRARLQADIADENSRHAQANETIDNLIQENRESKKTQEEKLATERELNQLREAEAERHRLAMQGIKDQGKKDEDETGPLGRIGLSIEDLREFAKVVDESIIPSAEILRSVFFQVADAIGSVVQQWVLLGETGPAVMRKILAQALASIAAEAAVNAVKELALGFAMLFLNPADSAAHFTSAALWGSIAGGAAFAGRAVAGDLFKSKSAAAGSSGRSGAGGNGELNPLNLARNAGPGAPQQIVPIIQPIVRVRVVPDGTKFGDAVTAHVVEDYNNAGPIREVTANDGNLNRG